MRRQELWRSSVGSVVGVEGMDDFAIKPQLFVCPKCGRVTASWVKFHEVMLLPSGVRTMALCLECYEKTE